MFERKSFAFSFFTVFCALFFPVVHRRNHTLNFTLANILSTVILVLLSAFLRLPLQFCERESRGLFESAFVTNRGSFMKKLLRLVKGAALVAVATLLSSSTATSIVETVAPVAVPTVVPSTATPVQAPSIAPSIVSPPSMAPSINTTDPPSVTPSLRPTPTSVPVTPPTGAPVTVTPTSEPVPQPHPTSIGRMIARTIGWMIFLALSVLCFGALMSNRYRIYYFFRGVWYAFLRLECTRWIIRKVRFRSNGPSSNASLNEIIFDQNDLREGLLLRDTT